MVERVNSFSIVPMQSNLGAAVSLDSTGHSVKNVIIYTMYLITFTICYACVSIYLFRYTFIMKTYYMYNMFRFNGRFYGRLNIMRQGVNICLYFCLLVFLLFCLTCKTLSFIFPLYLLPFIFCSICPHSALTVRSPYVQIAFTCALRPTPFALTAYKALTVRSECVYFALTVHSLIVHLDNITFRQITVHTCK